MPFQINQNMQNSNELITINSRKFDGKIHRSWKAAIIEQSDSLITFVGEFESDIKHTHLGFIRRGTVSYEYYWFNRWFNVFRFHEPEGDLRNFYCNVNMPPIYQNGVLDYVDLDIDVLVWKDYSYQILDLDEFEENSFRFGYPTEICDQAAASLSVLEAMIKKRDYPFSEFAPVLK